MRVVRVLNLRQVAGLGADDPVGTGAVCSSAASKRAEKTKPRIWGNLNPETKAKNIFFEVILTPIPK